MLARYISRENLIFVSCKFEHNEARYGAGADLDLAGGTFDDCTWEGNDAMFDGGGLYFSVSRCHRMTHDVCPALVFHTLSPHTTC